MTPDSIFSVANPTAMVGWVLLAVLPGRRIVTHVIAGVVVPALLALAYVGVLATGWPGSEGGFSSLADVARLFQNRWLLLAGWIHYLAFDLLIGAWEVRDAREQGVPHLLVLPCLALTFMFGPTGWLLYLVVRRAGGTARRPLPAGA
jgi:hypothetical protein